MADLPLERILPNKPPFTDVGVDYFGTNFIRAERELREALDGLNQNKIQNAMLQQGIRWNFNPPAGSHHGGVWERLICMVRNVLRSVLKR